jgi:hypothetical protein
MTALEYQASPETVAIGSDGAGSAVSMTLTASNPSTSSVKLASLSFTLPQGAGNTDLLAPGTMVSASSVYSSDGSVWSPSVNGNQVVIEPTALDGYGTLAPKGVLRVTLDGLQINSAGAGDTATIEVAEERYDGATTPGTIAIKKIDAGFQITQFTASFYNVDVGDPVTISWIVQGALSCQIDAAPLGATAVVGAGVDARHAAARHRLAPCGIGTSNPTCNGTITQGAALTGSNTCSIVGPTLFTLTAVGKSGGHDVTVVSQFMVTVNTASVAMVAFPPLVVLGQSVTLQWVSANAAVLTLYAEPSGSKTDLTSTPNGSEVLVPQASTTYSLYGFTRATDPLPASQASLSVVVDQPTWVQPPAVSQLPQPAYPGDTFTLNWAVVNVQSCSLTADLAPNPFPPLTLPLSGPQELTIPDPGVPQQTVTFTVSPEMYGPLGGFTPQTFAIPITNTPNVSVGLAASVSSAPPGGSVTLTWTVDHADTATITSDLPGAQPITVDPAAGQVVVTMPDAVIPVQITYTLTVTRQNGAYSATSATPVICTGAVEYAWTVGANSAGGTSTYLYSLARQFPNQPMTKIGASVDPTTGITGLFVWYSQNSAPDYSVHAMGTTDSPSTVLTLQPGEYVVSMETWYGNGGNGEDAYSYLCCIEIVTSLKNKWTAGWIPGNSQGAQGPCPATAAAGQQAIALGWDVAGGFDALGLVTCSTSYGGNG